MAYLVTGGTGFVGSYVVRDLLNEGKKVVCMQRSGVNPLFLETVGKENAEEAVIINVDVSNTLNVFKIIKDYNIDVIIHLSSLLSATGSSSSETNPSYALQVNAIGTNNMLEAARLFGLRKVVWTSTGQVFGGISRYYMEPLGDDDALYMPDTMYAATKALGEFMSKLYFNKFGVDSICLRMGFTLGIGKTLGKGGVFARFLKDMALDTPTVLAVTDADKIRAFSYIENISDLILKVCEYPATGRRIYNTVEFQCSMRQLVEIMCNVNPGARVSINDGVSPEEATLGGSPEPELDTRGVFGEFKWKPKYSLEDAVRNIFNYYRRQDGLSPL
ncbi:MAG: NAD(P)-dependent oxidoreductase [Deltaproteobacteria bacterium]|nr:NAD(P)-dependent oxidoreductase [Deltaproteobacteria bacterium]